MRLDEQLTKYLRVCVFQSFKLIISIVALLCRANASQPWEATVCYQDTSLPSLKAYHQTLVQGECCLLEPLSPNLGNESPLTSRHEATNHKKYMFSEIFPSSIIWYPSSSCGVFFIGRYGSNLTMRNQTVAVRYLDGTMTPFVKFLTNFPLIGIISDSWCMSSE